MSEFKSLARFIPHTMTDLPNWVLRINKIPYSALYNGKASSTNCKSWTTYEDVLCVYRANKEKYSGISFAVTLESRIIFIDIDHCYENGELNEIATDVLNELKDCSFVEVSQSGTGLHILTIGTIPKPFKNSKNGVEMYSQKRFVAITGNALIAKEPKENADALLRVYERYKTPEYTPPERPQYSVPVLSLSDSEIIDRASANEVSGDTFRALFSGGLCGYKSHSESDLRLCQILAFWTDRNAETILRIVKSSGAYRSKWERKDYATDTIRRACDSVRESLSEYKYRKSEEKQREYEKSLLQDW